MKTYVYFVSYSSRGSTGRFEVSRAKEVESILDIAGMERSLEKKDGITGAIINNYQLLRVEES